MTATAKEIETLRWLIAHGETEGIDGVRLWTKYRDESDLRPSAMRVTAWKRTSGRTMNRLKEKGLLKWNSATFGSGRVFYDVTEAGFEAAARW